MRGLFLLLTSLVCISSTLAQSFLSQWLQQFQPIFQPAQPSNSLTTCPCGNTNSKRIVGGKATEANEYPWMLSMIMTGTREHFCGASILTASFALTAAHCTNGVMQQISVLAGVHDRRRLGPGVQESRVSSVIQHEQYSQTMLGIFNDIAILALSTPLRFNANISPICVPAVPLNIENKEGKIIGWGKLGFNLPTSQTLQEIDVEIQDKGSCRATFPFFLARTMHCTSNPTATACMGDSGGPLIWLDPEINSYTVAGLVSYGPTGCRPSSPVVLTDVSAYFDWIQARIPQTLCYKVSQ